MQKLASKDLEEPAGMQKFLYQVKSYYVYIGLLSTYSCDLICSSMYED